MDPEEDIPVDDEFGAPLDEEFGEAAPASRLQVDDPNRGDRGAIRVHGLQFDPIDVMSDEPIAEPHEADFEVWSKDDPDGSEQFGDPEVAQRAGMAQERTDREARIRQALGDGPGLAESVLLPTQAAGRALGRAGGQAATEFMQHPEAAIGAFQGATSEWGDELAGLIAQAQSTDPSMGLGMAPGYIPVDEEAMPSVEEQESIGTDARQYVQDTSRRAQEAAPHAYGAAYLGGAVGQAMAMPLPVGGMGAVGRMATSTLAGGAQGALTGAGAAEDGNRLEAAEEGLDEGLLWGAGGAVLGEGLQAGLRAPGALRGAGEDLGAHADHMRLRQSGVRGPAALRAADQAFPERGMGQGRHILADELRQRGHGEVMGVPMPGRSLDDTVDLLAETGPQIGNPIAGPRSLGDVERELDTMGAHIDMNAVADELIRRASHEQTIGAGGAYDQVVELAEQLRGRPRSVPLDTSARFDPNAPTNIPGAPEGARGAYVEVEQPRGRTTELPPNPIVRFSTAHRQRQALQQREFPGVPPYYLEQAEEILNEHMERAARQADVQSLDAAGRRLDLISIADELEQSMRTAGVAPDAIAALVEPLRSRGLVPMSEGTNIQAALVREARTRGEAAQARGAARAVGGGTAPVRGRRARAPEPTASVVPGEYVRQAQEMIDGQVASALEQSGNLSQRWVDLNREYTIGRFMLQHGRSADRAGDASGMMLGEGAAVRRALAGDPSDLLRLEATRTGTGFARDVMGGAWTRGVEYTSRTMVNVADVLTDMLGSNPERLGPYAAQIQQASARGPAGVAAWHYQQAMQDQGYREWLAQQGLTGDEEDTEPYDFLTEGLTAEDVYAGQ